LAIAGHSKGAVVALMLAAQHPMPCSLVINVSGRYDASNLLSPVARFTKEQREQLDRDGSFTWLTYRAGPEPERPLRRFGSKPRA
jgi:enterochelin esterase-like enzyme